jgi:hypothetical protein
MPLLVEVSAHANLPGYGSFLKNVSDIFRFICKYTVCPKGRQLQDQ